MSHNITIEGGTSVRLPTAGKYCDRDIIITAEGGKEDLDAVLTEQDNLIDELREVLKSKGSGEAEPVIEPLEVTENGTYNAPAGVDGYSPVAVNVPVPDGYIIPSGSKSITENGTHDVTEFAAVEVNVEGSGGGDDVASGIVDGTATEVELDSSEVRNYAFYNHTKLVTAHFPKATRIGVSAFYGCSKLTSLNAPNVISLGTDAFENCKVLTRIVFPLLTSSVDCFGDCTSLALADLGMTPSLASGAFLKCINLKTLILRKSDAICSLTNTYTFQGTPIAAKKGHIYVPAALVASYQENSTWSTYASLFRALEDYTVDGTITGALDETKI